MVNLSKTNWLTIVLVIAICIAGIFVYQWWQVKGELARQIGQNENLTKQVDELQKEIEGFKAPEEKITDETTEWKTYKNKERGVEIKYPNDWELDVVDPFHSVEFTKETSREKVRLVIGINLYGESGGVFPGCEFEGEEIIVGNNRVRPIISSSFENKSLEIIAKTKEECEQQILEDSHAVILEMCFGKDLKYLGNYCEEGSGNYYYQFYLHCEGENWQGKEGMNKCSQLFNQIISTFRFIK